MQLHYLNFNLSPKGTWNSNRCVTPMMTHCPHAIDLSEALLSIFAGNINIYICKYYVNFFQFNACGLPLKILDKTCNGICK